MLTTGTAARLSGCSLTTALIDAQIRLLYKEVRVRVQLHFLEERDDGNDDLSAVGEKSLLSYWRLQPPY